MKATAERSVLLTGGTGFVGSRLARRLLSENFSVTVLAQSTSRLDLLQQAGVAEQIEIVRGAPGCQDLPDMLAELRPDIVIHVASVSRGGESPPEITRMIEANITFPALLLAAMRTAGVRRFVNTGTSWQTIADHDGYSPFNFYAGTKQALEDLLACFCLDGMAAITLRLFDTYGPHDPRRKIVDLIADAAEHGTELAMSPGGQVIDLVHVEDVAQAFAAAANRLLTDVVEGHEIYGVSGDRVVLRELASRIGQAVGRAPQIKWGGRPYRAREVMLPWTGLRPVPGWAPRIGLDEGLRELAAARAGPADAAP